MKNTTAYFIKYNRPILLSAIATGLFFVYSIVFSQEKNDIKLSNEKLIQQYIDAKGENTIVFDSSNIKQFWIDSSIAGRNNSIEILLNESGSGSLDSIPLKIQLRNVNATQDCIIEVITENDDISYSVLNNKSTVISEAPSKSSFLQYNVLSSSFHLEDTDFSFSLKFSSKTLNVLQIKKVILLFSGNKNFLASPGTLNISDKEIKKDNLRGEDDNGHSFIIAGRKSFAVASTKRILVGDHPVSNSVKIKNEGNSSVVVYLGYAPYTKNLQRIDNKSNPYAATNEILNVISSEINTKIITVNSYPEWEKGCSIVLNAQQDLSDFPNSNYIDGKIVNVKRIDEKQSEIEVDKPIKKPINAGTKIRIQSKDAAAYIYTNYKQLNPGEEITFSSTLKKDDAFLKYSPKAFCRGTDYVVPIILTTSPDPQEDIVLQVSDYTISY